MRFYLSPFICFLMVSLTFGGNPVAVPMSFHVQKNKQKYLTLAAYSDQITYRRASFGETPIDFGIRYKDAIQEWQITHIPEHGTLFEGSNPIAQVPTVISDPDQLLYIPDKGFSGTDQFTFTVQDSDAVSADATVELMVETELSLPESIPPFPDMFTVPTPNPAASGQMENDDWYIDNSHPNADDEPVIGESDPRHGTPDRPRLTLPPNQSVFAAGARVFIRGGVVTPYQTRTGVSWHQWICNGTTENPVLISGVVDSPDKPIIEGLEGSELRLQMQHTLIEGLHFRGLRISQRSGPNEGHVVFRHCLIDGLNTGTSGAGITLNQGDYNMLLDVHLRRIGFTEPDLSEENDVHGIQISRSNFWLLDNLIHGCAGDSIQINGETAANIFIARNKLHSDNENAVDFKRRYDLVFVENDVWDYRAISYQSSGSDGTPVIINQDTSGQTPTRCTLARNRIWDANGGIRHQGQDIQTTNNLLFLIHHNSNTETPAYAITVGNNGYVDYVDRISHNTFHLVDGGIWIWAGNNAGLKDHRYSNNLFSTLNPDSIEPFHFNISGNHTEGTSCDYNLYVGEAELEWAGTIRDLTWLRANTDNGVMDQEVLDPGFIDEGLFNFRLHQDSAAVDSGSESVCYQEFWEWYGLGLAFDFFGQPRPWGDGWDIGAHEFRLFCDLALDSWQDPQFYDPNLDFNADGWIGVRDLVFQINQCGLSTQSMVQSQEMNPKILY